MDFKKYDNPKVSVSKELSHKDIYAAIFTEKDLDAIPSFLTAVKENQFVLEELKKNKCVTIYGGPSDVFKQAFVFVSKFGTEYGFV